MAQSVLDSAIAFCEDSLVLREQLDDLATTAGASVYELDVPTQQSVARILTVTLDDQVLTPVPSEMVAAFDKREGKPVSYYTRRNGSVLELVFYPTPDKRYLISTQVALRPKRSATQLEDDLYELWLEPIVAGAVARIAAIPNQPFSDPMKAQSALTMASIGSRKARNEGAFGRVRGSLSMRITPRKFA